MSDLPNDSQNNSHSEVIEVHTPCRLHFGLLALSRADDHRQYGGAGVMINQPHITLRITAKPDQPNFTADGPLSQSALGMAGQFIAQATKRDDTRPSPFTPITGGHIEILSAPRPHTGLGTGTQLGMAIACAMARLSNVNALDVPAMASLVGRGRRSAIGAYGFGQGGFIVEGGKLDSSKLSPLLLRHDFPSTWRLVLVSPQKLQGLAGSREIEAFAQMPDIAKDISGRMCRLVLLGLTPAIIEQDMQSFGQALYELQHLVGECFAAAQGGIWADPMLESIVNQLRRWGVQGVGQSSWGPTLYALTGDEDEAKHLSQKLRVTFGLGEDEVTITAANNQGGQWKWIA